MRLDKVMSLCLEDHFYSLSHSVQKEKVSLESIYPQMVVGDQARF